MTQENGQSANEPETRRIPEATPEAAAAPAPDNLPPTPPVPPQGDTFASPAERIPAGPGHQEPGHQHAAGRDSAGRDSADRDSADRDSAGRNGAQAYPDHPGQGMPYQGEPYPSAQYPGAQYPGPQYQSPQNQPPAYPGTAATGQQYLGAGAPYPGGYGAPGAGYGYQAPPARTLSLISMVLGIVSIATLGATFFTQIAAVILGHIALKREPAGRGMALAGLIMGYVTIGLGILLVILAIILFAGAVPYFSTTSGAEFSV